ncbi:hypothetical protein GCM10009700_31900 [Brevibacterium sanguinis]|uniref:hypothetical protein n=1 Tax=Brevibacterium sanguinis TaxID=232444 RepID=UPI0031E3311E
MTEKTYTAADFAAARFAEKDDYVGMRDEQDAGRPWTIKRIGGTYQSRRSDRGMVDLLWTPVPATPAVRTITKNKYTEIRDELVRVGAVRGDSEFFVIVTALGIEVVPDPEPTNAERLNGLLVEFTHLNASCGGEQGDHALAAFLDAHGVIAPGGDET